MGRKQNGMGKVKVEFGYVRFDIQGSNEVSYGTEKY